MGRTSHGALLLDTSQPPIQPAAANPNKKPADCPATTNFNYLFPALQKNATDRLPDHDEMGRPMPETLMALGIAMVEPKVKDFPSKDLDSKIPSAYTYFGQFITHELVFEVTTKDRKLGRDTHPLDRAEIPRLENARTTLLDLDSVYGPMIDNHGQCFAVPMQDEKMVLGVAGVGDETLPGFDLKRETDVPFTALIGDRRNDSNLIVTQLHLAFLRAHNILIENHNSFAVAQKTLRQHFQWLVINDYLKRVVDPDVFESVRKGTIDPFWIAGKQQPFVPVEFSAAAFRFAHSMPRRTYNVNRIHDAEDLTSLFLPIPQYSRLLAAWIIDWERFLDRGPDFVFDKEPNFARRIDTRVVQPLFQLKDSDGKPVVDSGTPPQRIGLAALDLLRGYLLGLPTGQAVARELGEPELSESQIENAGGKFVKDEVAAKQKEILHESGLCKRTPLWFYILAEAAVQKEGLCLGRVGSIIVAAVLMGLVARSTDSILQDPNWQPTLGNGKFDLTELFKFAKVLPRPKPKETT
jgi:hypothetical protein